ncbi:MAG: M13 family metallopeptidase [Patescibacteria group bacterium]|nr:M13 family metallopeptidase [Patescibacteria group bacterium]
MKKTSKRSWGFDTATIDQSVRPQDDFYHFANGGWLRDNSIPPTESRWGSFTILRYKTEHQLRSIIKELLHKKNLPSGSPAQLVRDFYYSAIDLEAREKRGLKPLSKWRAEIASLLSLKEMLEYISRMHRIGGSALWLTAIDQDSKKSSRYILHLWQGGIGMPDREYYLSDAPEQKRVRNAYIVYITKLFSLVGHKSLEARRRAQIVLSIETELARASMRKEDLRDPHKTYHKKKLRELFLLLPHVDWRGYFKIQGINAKEVIVGQPEFFRALDTLLASVSLEEWKIYLEWHLLSDWAPALSKEFLRVSFNFYGRALAGNKKMRPLWRRSLGAVNGNIGEALGALYVERHFTKDAKRRMNALIEDLVAVYTERIRDLDWMSPGTKQKALRKLTTTNWKIGYPARFERYKGLLIQSGDYFGNLLRSAEYIHRREVRRLNRPVDRKRWYMTPQTVNAYHASNLNEIVFPAAILQAPFFDLHADSAVNYAAIGATIGHELTHGFDDQGSKFDGAGNMRNWWSKRDEGRFKKKSNILVKQFDSYEILPGLRANGELTLGENIADLGGLSIAYDAYQRHLRTHGRTIIDGFTPEERFFLGFAQVERELSRKEFIRMITLNDVHAFSPLRVNGPLSNFTPFYKAFGLKKGDKLYREEKKRAKIW